MKIKIRSKHERWYRSNRPVYEGLSATVHGILENLLKEEKVDFLSVTSRAKTIDSFVNKVDRKSYENPEQEISDLAGIRVITYIEGDIDKISEIVKSSFNVHPLKSLNKTDELGIDKVGYRSVHFVCDLGEIRCSLREFSKYKDLLFEIQIRTVLQHAWAEIEHDRNYKFSGILPKHIQRRLYTLAGVLELADREFTSLASEVDRYAEEVSEKTNIGNFEIEINTTSLLNYLPDKLKKSNAKVFDLVKDTEDTITYSEIIQELNGFGLTKLSELDNILSSNFFNSYVKHAPKATYLGLLRDAMIFEDIEKYFETAWIGSWTTTNDWRIEFWSEKYGKATVSRITSKFGIHSEDIDFGEINLNDY